MPDQKWESHFADIQKELVDGTKARGPLMRCWDGSKWIYRAMTPDEMQEWSSRDAW